MKAPDRDAICVGDLRQRKVVVDVLRELLPERMALGLRRPAELVAVEVARIDDRLTGRVVVVVMDALERILRVDLGDLVLLRHAAGVLALLVGLAVPVDLAAFDRLLVLVVRDALVLLDLGL